ncbi:MAG: hypothetical protein GIX03_07905 [Candidatus Eremiobacteraeota bacterium]|nr:hypothetical protein [Candidatus Eremiobacteraeota bacterium]MBC5802911.1 hypothetical protein [Candidatus Eremiobacteraeota bacterium]MBC5821133.1 hypothetical protein [Candidatus Eremiobacteraeota bacterium]
MIRANLLPRPKETFGVFGVAFDAEYLRQALLGLAIAAAVTLLGAGIEALRVHRLTAAVAEADGAIAARAPERAQAKRLALDVARYQQFARQAQLFRRSGSDVAIAIARIGNEVPSGVWVDQIAHEQDAYDLNGGSRSVSVISDAMLSLGSAIPGTTASLVDIQNRSDDGVHFSARVAPRSMGAQQTLPSGSVTVPR